MNATPAQAKRLIIISMLVAGGLASISEFAERDLPRLRIALGVVIGGILLAVIAELSPSLAAGFAALILVTSTLVLGRSAWDRISNVVEGG